PWNSRVRVNAVSVLSSTTSTSRPCKPIDVSEGGSPVIIHLPYYLCSRQPKYRCRTLAGPRRCDLERAALQRHNADAKVQPQPGPFDIVRTAGDAREALAKPLQLLRRNSRAVVADLADHLRASVRHRACDDAP